MTEQDAEQPKDPAPKVHTATLSEPKATPGDKPAKPKKPKKSDEQKAKEAAIKKRK